MFQCAGRKRVCLIPPRHSHKAVPVTYAGMISFRDFSGEDKLHYLRFAHAYDAVWSCPCQTGQPSELNCLES